MPTDASGVVNFSLAAPDIYISIDVSNSVVTIETPADALGNYPGGSHGHPQISYYYKISGILPEGTTQDVFQLRVVIDACGSPTVFTSPTVVQ